jgi:putative ABC transport system permease protein
MSKGLMFLATKIIRPSWPYTIRQGLANLFRPNNRTVMLMISMGLGTFLILTLYLVQETLVHAFDPAVGSLRPNVILFDIQQDQVEGVRQVILEEGFQMLDRVPIVTMQLLSINDKSVESFLKNPESSVEKWALRREYRCTYRESLSDSEKLIQGDWIPRFTGDIEEVIPVSIEEGIAEALDIGLGDRLIFDVQGLSIQTQIRSMRQVDWKRAEPNFFVVFPSGVLEDAPGFHIVTTRVDSAAASARLQKAIVGKYANISMVDLNLIMNTLDQILSRMTYVIKFMTLFTLLTGLAVLVSTVWNSRMQRLQEFILLRILGASRNQIIQIQVFEYLILGTLAAATGALLSIAAGWGLARFFFEIPFRMNWEMLLLAFATVSLMTLPVGMLSLRGLFLQPPLEVLRRES